MYTVSGHNFNMPGGERTRVYKPVSIPKSCRSVPVAN